MNTKQKGSPMRWAFLLLKKFSFRFRKARSLVESSPSRQAVFHSR
ncbi:hypothetical protein IQ22_01054 [Pseudomonas duriflava]|uniref:Uncharacterized protein n=1 Tax=Pseudomonas duriflava TaxID=459528 RepID=A0A562QIU8_9PSED|nr:hypothetical protein IQ22_01054 [Pseudomonas duriflava]